MDPLEKKLIPQFNKDVKRIEELEEEIYEEKRTSGRLSKELYQANRLLQHQRTVPEKSSTSTKHRQFFYYLKHWYLKNCHKRQKLKHRNGQIGETISTFTKAVLSENFSNTYPLSKSKNSKLIK